MPDPPKISKVLTTVKICKCPTFSKLQYSYFMGYYTTIKIAKKEA